MLLYVNLWEGLGKACPCQPRQQQACPSLAKIDNWFNGQQCKNKRIGPTSSSHALGGDCIQQAVVGYIVTPTHFIWSYKLNPLAKA